MFNDIKGYHTIDKRWYPVASVGIYDGVSHLIDTGIEGEIVPPIRAAKPSTLVLVYFTGKRDINDKKIYSGDNILCLLEGDQVSGTVIYSQEYAAFIVSGLTETEEDGEITLSHTKEKVPLLQKCYNIEIVGNKIEADILEQIEVKEEENN